MTQVKMTNQPFDHNWINRTTALFWETSKGEYTYTKWTLKTREHKGYPSLYKSYMTYMDPSEYFFATEVIGSWEHWERIAASPLIRPVIEKWRKELEVKVKATALKAMVEKSATGDTPASKYLIEAWKMPGTPKRGRGRPKKEPEPTVDSDIDWQADLERIKLI